MIFSFVIVFSPVQYLESIGPGRAAQFLDYLSCGGNRDQQVASAEMQQFGNLDRAALSVLDYSRSSHKPPPKFVKTTATHVKKRAWGLDRGVALNYRRPDFLSIVLLCWLTLRQ